MAKASLSPSKTEGKRSDDRHTEPWQIPRPSPEFSCDKERLYPVTFQQKPNALLLDFH